jgi:hypothetical protein
MRSYERKATGSSSNGKVAQQIRKVGITGLYQHHGCGGIGLPGCYERIARRLSSQLPALGALEGWPFETPADAACGWLRARLEQASGLIGANDLLMAAQALGYTIVTNNENEFAPVEDLRRGNGLR